MNATPPAGWYEDPHGEAELRYWDGSTWTEHTSGPAPGAAAPTQLDQPQAAPAAQAPAGYQQPAGPVPGAPGGGGNTRRNLLIGLGALVLIGAVVAVLLLAGGGGDDNGGNQDEEDIRALVEETLDDPSDDGVCENFTDEVLDRLTNGASDCAEAVSANEDVEYEITDVNVRGDEGTVEVEIDGNDESIDVEKDGDDWKFSEDVAGVCCVSGVGVIDTDTVTTDTTPSGDAETQVRDVVNRWLEAVRTEDAEEFCSTTSVRFAEDRGVTGATDEIIERCPEEAPRMIDELIIAEGPEIETVEITGTTDSPEARVTLTDTSVLTLVNAGDFWFVDTFK
jgi:hypothetical protein